MSPRADAGRVLDPRLRAILAAVSWCGVALALGMLALSPKAALSVAIGAGIAAGNLWVLARVVTALLSDEPSRPNGAGGWVLLALLKMLGLLTVVWLLLTHGIVAPLPMLAGFGALPIGIAIGSMVSDRSAIP